MTLTLLKEGGILVKLGSDAIGLETSKAFEAPRGGAYNNRKHLKLETPCS